MDQEKKSQLNPVTNQKGDVVQLELNPTERDQQDKNGKQIDNDFIQQQQYEKKPEINDQNVVLLNKNQVEEEQTEQEEIEGKYKPNLEEGANCWEKLTFSYVYKLIQMGLDKERFEGIILINLMPFLRLETDLYDITEREKVNNCIALIRKTEKQFPDRSFLYRLFYTVKAECILSIIYASASGLVSFAGPIFMNLIINYLEDPNEPTYLGYIYVLCIFVSYIIKALLNQHSQLLNMRLQFQCINQLCGLMYEKTINISFQAKKYLEAGKMTTLVLMNLVELMVFFQWFFVVVQAPILIIAATIYIVIVLGWIGLIGPALMFVFGIILTKIQNKQKQLRMTFFVNIDERSKRINEFMQGIKIIKYYAWEKFVQQQLNDIREREMKLLFDFNMNIGVVDTISQIAPTFISIAVFGFYILQGQVLTPSKAYVVLSLLNLLNFPISQLLSGWQNYINAQISMNRIQHFLKAEEKQKDYSQLAQQKGEIQIQNCEFTWTSKYTEEHHEQDPDLIRHKQLMADLMKKEEEKLKKEGKFDEEKKKQLESQNKVTQEQIEATHLTVANLDIQPGQFIAVVGQYAAGKSSLLNAIMGEMKKKQGVVKLNGKIGYISQTPWLRNHTIRENITFGEKYDKKKMENILTITELVPDLELFEGGDLTELGERGVNLSGGQKQRVSIARAIYSDPDILLVDDCLSSLDSYVGKKIFTNVFQKYCKGKTIIFVTHALQYLQLFDKVLVIKQGQLIEEGTYQNLLQNPLSNLQQLIVAIKQENKNVEEKEEGKEQELPDLQLQKERSSMKPTEQKNKIQDKTEIEKKEQGEIIKNEAKAEGVVPFHVYKRYFFLGGTCRFIICFSIFAITQVLRQFTDYWLGLWSENAFGSQGFTQSTYVWIYAILSFGSAVFFLVRYTTFIDFSTNISRNIFQTLLKVIVHAPMSFFDTTPLGRIVTRFTSDIDKIDFGLAFVMQFAIYGILGIFCSIIMITIITPYFIIPSFFFFLYYLRILKKYLVVTFFLFFQAILLIQSGREVRRILDVVRAPLVGRFQEASQGVGIIRAYRKQKYFNKFFSSAVNQHTRATMNESYGQRWMGMSTDILSAFIIGFAALFGVIARNSSNQYFGALIGLSLTWAFQIAAQFPVTVIILSQIETNMNSAQRIFDYTDSTPQEKSYEEPQKPINWPSNGVYNIQNMNFRYRENLPLVIKNLSFDIQSYEKIGIIGRTGSGKSTLTLGFLRILELAKESQKNSDFQLDNVQISDVGLYHLRSNCAIIPQEPVLFQGTIRSNIDPFNIYKDKEIVDNLKQVNLWEQIQSKLKDKNQNGQQIQQIQKQNDEEIHLKINEQSLQEDEQEKLVLSLKVEANGENFSLGERQLMCMVRVLIKHPKVLLMDEATASIDEKTDNFIQNMIKEKFSKTTVITIAHRLNTIIQYDKILILADGIKIQYDTPINLLRDKQSYLWKLVSEQGKEFEQKMLQMALQ